ncbi:MAG: zinc-ribbon domain-containing protein [Thermoproteota archaeon]
MSDGFLRYATEILSLDRIAALFLLNSKAHEDKIAASIKGLFRNHISCGTEGMKLVRFLGRGKLINPFYPYVKSNSRWWRLTMSYEFLSNSELIHEVGVLEKITSSLASQAEKLARLKAEGKVSDSAYKEVFEDLRKKAEVTSRKKEELLSAANDRIKQTENESNQLRHQLEVLEVRHAIGAIPSEKYKVAQEGFLMQLAELDETRKRIDELIAQITENTRHLNQYVSGIVVMKPKEPTVEQPQITPKPTPVQPTTKHVEEVPKPPITFTQPKPETKTVEVRAETSKPKVKKCSRCGAENLESASYCYNCGARL